MNTISDAGSVVISIKGKPVQVPAVHVNGRTIFVSGKWLKIALVHDEAWAVGQPVEDPQACLDKIRQNGLRADVFTFRQALPLVEPKYDYPMVMDNVAAIDTSDFKVWWEQRLPQETRKNVRRSAKRGVTVREVEFSDELIRQIVEINNESPIRQGRRFWHYGKSFEVVKKDYSTFMDRSVYIGAYHENALIGFIKMIYMGEIAGIMQLVCMHRHQDKRTPNALITRAVEICHAKGLKYMTYGQYIYANHARSALTEFKKRNGFEQKLLPRYYVPLTGWGRIAMGLGLHLSFKRFLPERVHFFLGNLRTRWYQRSLSGGKDAGKSPEKTSSAQD
jgi:hypothetical protein